MLKVVEYGLLAVSLLTILGLILSAPKTPERSPVEAGDSNLDTKIPPTGNQ